MYSSFNLQRSFVLILFVCFLNVIFALTPEELPSGSYSGTLHDGTEQGCPFTAHVSWIEGKAVITLNLSKLTGQQLFDVQSALRVMTWENNLAWCNPKFFQMPSSNFGPTTIFLDTITQAPAAIESFLFEGDWAPFQDLAQNTGPTARSVTISTSLALKIARVNLPAITEMVDVQFTLINTNYRVGIGTPPPGTLLAIPLFSDSVVNIEQQNPRVYSIDIGPEAQLNLFSGRTLTVDHEIRNSGEIQMRGGSTIDGQGTLINGYGSNQNGNGLWFSTLFPGNVTLSINVDNRRPLLVPANTVLQLKGSFLNADSYIEALAGGRVDLSDNCVLTGGLLRGSGLFTGNGGSTDGHTDLMSHMQVTDKHLTNEGVLTVTGTDSLLETSNSTELYSWQLGGSSRCPLIESILFGNGSVVVGNGSEVQLNSAHKYSHRSSSGGQIYHWGYNRRGVINNNITIEAGGKLSSKDYGGARNANVINGSLTNYGNVVVDYDLAVNGRFINNDSCNVSGCLSLNLEVANTSEITLVNGGIINFGTDSSNITENHIVGNGTVRGISSGSKLILDTTSQLYLDGLTSRNELELIGNGQVTNNHLTNEGVLTVLGAGSLLETSKSKELYSWQLGGSSRCPLIESILFGNGSVVVGNGSEVQLNSAHKYSHRSSSGGQIYHWGYNRRGVINNNITIEAGGKLSSKDYGGARNANVINGSLTNYGNVVVDYDLAVNGRFINNDSCNVSGCLSLNLEVDVDHR
jgi:hypothetical protein